MRTDINLIPDGVHALEGFCDYNDFEERNGLIIRLDGKNYVCYEDPSDGYRSFCEIKETELPCFNIFPMQKVIVKNFQTTANVDDEDDDTVPTQGLTIFNAQGELILKIATEYYDDYYPTAVYEWHPENLPINKGITSFGYYKMPAALSMKLREYIFAKEDDRDSIGDILLFIDKYYRQNYYNGVHDVIEKIEMAIDDDIRFEDLTIAQCVATLDRLLTVVKALKAEWEKAKNELNNNNKGN